MTREVFRTHRKHGETTGEALENALRVADVIPGDWRVEDLDEETVPRLRKFLRSEGWKV